MSGQRIRVFNLCLVFPRLRQTHFHVQLVGLQGGSCFLPLPHQFDIFFKGRHGRVRCTLKRTRLPHHQVSLRDFIAQHLPHRFGTVSAGSEPRKCGVPLGNVPTARIKRNGKHSAGVPVVHIGNVIEIQCG